MPVAREIKDLLGSLPNTFHVVKKRDHYFLYDGSTCVSCVGNNASRENIFLGKRSRAKIEKYIANKNTQENNDERDNG